jgi:DNA-directed DNA polymerase III PolC
VSDALILVRSAYSLLRASALPDHLAATAAKRGVRALALVDWENLYGAIPFLDACVRHGLHGMLGAEVALPIPVTSEAGPRTIGPGATPTRDGAPARLILLCREMEGYRSLALVLTRLHLDGPAAAAAALREGARGLTVLSDSCDALTALLRSVPARDLGALLVRPSGDGRRDARLLQWAERNAVAGVASCFVSMCDPHAARTEELLTAIRLHASVGAGAGASAVPGSLMPTAAQARELFDDEPRARRAARALIERCGLSLGDLTPARFILPTVAGREGPARLRGACARGLRRLRLTRSRAALARLTQELEVIETLGFVDYFLIVAEIVDWARARGIRTVGRGSGASSIVAYLLGVTNVDPLRHDLCFERFLHPLRRDLPDLDIDIAWDRRDEVLDFALARFGRERAAMVGTHQFFRARGAFREAGRALGLSDAQIHRGSRRLPHAFFGQTVPASDPAAGAHALGEPAADMERGEPAGETDALAAAPDEARALRQLTDDDDPAVGRAAAAALRLLDLPRQLGTHPGGIVLADGPLGRVVPLERSAGGLTVTQFEMRAIERIGLVKIDLLGNRALGTVGEAFARIAGARPGAVDGAGGIAGNVAGNVPRTNACHDDGGGTAPRVDPAAGIPPDDPATARLLVSGRTLGCFQIESPAMRTLLRQLRPHDVAGVIAAVALIRPGPAGSGMKAAYIRRAHGEEPVTVRAPVLRDLLRETFGLPLYEEDVIRMAAAVTGSSLAEADLLRRAVGEAAQRARDAARRAAAAAPGGAEALALARLEAGFVAAAAVSGVAGASARAVWSDLLRFCAYAFCKAHAAGYGVIAYQTAWLKAHHPGAFFAGVLNHHGGMYPRRIYVDDARRHGLTLQPPCVQAGGRAWDWLPESGTPGALRCGLGMLRGLHATTIDALLAARAQRPLRDLSDLARRVPASAPELEALVLSGACDAAFGEARGELLWQLQRILGRRRRGAANAARATHAVSATAQPVPGQASLGLPARESGERPRHSRWRPVSREHRARLEREWLGVSLAAHPMALLPSQPGGRGEPIAAALSRARGRARVVGLVAAMRRIRSAGGSPVLFVTLEDETGLLEGALTRDDLARTLPGFSVGSYLEVSGELRDARGAVSLAIDGVHVLGAH